MRAGTLGSAVPFLAAALLVCACAVASAASRVELKDGRVLVGQVHTNRDGSVIVRTDDDVEVFTASEVRQVVHDVDKAVETGAEGADAGAEASSSAARAERWTWTSLLGIPSESTDETAASAAPLPSEPLPAARVRELRAEISDAADDDAGARAVLDVVRDLEAKDATQRVRGMETITAGWPDSRPAFRAALLLGNDQARLDAVRLLREPALGDTSALCGLALKDASDAVRGQALRAIRDRGIAALEPQVLAILCDDGPWPVRKEAARALERIGGKATFPVAVRLWEVELDPWRKRSLKRLIRTLLGADLGDEPKPWLDAVWSVEVGDRELRTPESRRRAPK